MSGTDIQLVCIACPVGCRLTVRKAAPEAAKGAPAAAKGASAAAKGASAAARGAPADAGAEGAPSVEGNRCPKGEIYGREEILAPRRTVTAAVLTDSEAYPCMPVRTDRPLAREMVRDLLRELYRSRIRLPVKAGDALIGDWRGTGVRVVATRTLPPDQVPPVREPCAEAEGDDQVARP